MSGANTVTYFGFLRNNFSAYLSITSKPLDACKNPEQVTTAIIVSITSIGGLPGTKPTTNTKKVKPIPDTAASPKPPKRTPTTRQAINTINPKISI